MKARLQQFMTGRYGSDGLNQMISIVAIILCVVTMFLRWPLLNLLAMALLVVCIFRMFSRNREKRAAENYAYYRLRGRVVHFFKSGVKRDRTHRQYKCPTCKQKLRVPRGRGTISIHCPKCSTDFVKKT